MEPNRDQQHLPGRASGRSASRSAMACVLVGRDQLDRSAVVGAAIAVFCATLWIRDSTRGLLDAPLERAPETRPPRPARRAAPTTAARARTTTRTIERYPRKVFLEGATLGLGALIGGIVTVPVVGFMVAPAFVNQHPKKRRPRADRRTSPRTSS